MTHPHEGFKIYVLEDYIMIWEKAQKKIADKIVCTI